MKLKEITFLELTPGQLVYKIINGEITSYNYLGIHPKYKECIIMGSTNNVFKAKVFHVSQHVSTIWEVDYEIAKEIMWEQLLNNLNSVNETYFEGLKKNLPTKISTQI